MEPDSGVEPLAVANHVTVDYHQPREARNGGPGGNRTLPSYLAKLVNQNGNVRRRDHSHKFFSNHFNRAGRICRNEIKFYIN